MHEINHFGGAKFINYHVWWIVHVILCWLQKGDNCSPVLPVAADGATLLANEEVKKDSDSVKEKWYIVHVPQLQRRKTCAKAMKCLRENGNKAAATKFSTDLGHVVPDSTVWNIKKPYLSLLQKERDPDRIKNLSRTARQWPLLQLHQDFMRSWKYSELLNSLYCSQSYRVPQKKTQHS